jgi:excisionase family DNA binding protein
MLSFSTTHLAQTMPSSPADNAIMTIGEVADYLKVTERTIYRLAGAKKIPSFKVGGSWRFSKADIDIWITRQSNSFDENATEGRSK